MNRNKLKIRDTARGWDNVHTHTRYIYHNVVVDISPYTNTQLRKMLYGSGSTSSHMRITVKVRIGDTTHSSPAVIRHLLGLNEKGEVVEMIPWSVKGKIQRVIDIIETLERGGYINEHY